MVFRIYSSLYGGAWRTICGAEHRTRVGYVHLTNCTISPVVVMLFLMHMNCSQSLFLFLFLRMLKASNRCSIKESLVLRSLELYSDSHLRLSFATVLPKSKDTIHQVLIKVSLMIAIIYMVHSPPQHQLCHMGSHISEFLVPEAKFQCPHEPLFQSFSQRKQLLRQEITIELQNGPGAAVWRKTELRLSIVIIRMQDRVEAGR